MDAKLAFTLLSLMDGALRWFEQRGIERDRAQALLDQYRDGDLPDDVLQGELDDGQAALDRVKGKIEDLPT